MGWPISCSRSPEAIWSVTMAQLSMKNLGLYVHHLCCFLSLGAHCIFLLSWDEWSEIGGCWSLVDKGGITGGVFGSKGGRTVDHSWERDVHGDKKDKGTIEQKENVAAWIVVCIGVFYNSWTRTMRLLHWLSSNTLTFEKEWVLFTRALTGIRIALNSIANCKTKMEVYKPQLTVSGR